MHDECTYIPDSGLRKAFRAAELLVKGLQEALPADPQKPQCPFGFPDPDPAAFPEDHLPSSVKADLRLVLVPMGRMGQLQSDQILCRKDQASGVHGLGTDGRHDNDAARGLIAAGGPDVQGRAAVSEGLQADAAGHRPATVAAAAGVGLILFFF